MRLNVLNVLRHSKSSTVAPFKFLSSTHRKTQTKCYLKRLQFSIFCCVLLLLLAFFSSLYALLLSCFAVCLMFSVWFVYKKRICCWKKKNEHGMRAHTHLGISRICLCHTHSTASGINCATEQRARRVNLLPPLRWQAAACLKAFIVCKIRDLHAFCLS